MNHVANIYIYIICTRVYVCKLYKHGAYTRMHTIYPSDLFIACFRMLAIKYMAIANKMYDDQQYNIYLLMNKLENKSLM